MLHRVRFVLPAHPATFGNAFLGILARFGTLENQQCRLRASDPRHRPKVSVELGDVVVPVVEFAVGHSVMSVELRNTSGIERSSPYQYSHISLEDFLDRAADLRLTALDHIGFDLPWFHGTHPEVLGLREALAGSCAYHLFPSGEDWDFILPASPEEIAGAELDPAVVRRPKVEIVSFDTVSVPLIQVDLVTDSSYAELTRRFPEGLADAGLGNVWVYLASPYGIDVCLVLNQDKGEPDWSGVFRGHRLVASGAGSAS